MRVNIEEISSTKRGLRIEVPAERLSEKVETAYSHLAKKGSIAGLPPRQDSARSPAFTF
ncbi:MAG: trigger factor family protein [Candidatus Methylomirabilis sp.]|nr:trigger factor family protein [Candidatus Methylomirabilis sp.]